MELTIYLPSETHIRVGCPLLPDQSCKFGREVDSTRRGGIQVI